MSKLSNNQCKNFKSHYWLKVVKQKKLKCQFHNKLLTSAWWSNSESESCRVTVERGDRLMLQQAPLCLHVVVYAMWLNIIFGLSLVAVCNY